MNTHTTTYTARLLFGAVLAALATLGLSSCKEDDDFLNLKPLAQVSQEDYYTNAEALGNFTINYYPTIFSRNDGWNAGMAGWDNGTDNQADRGGNTARFLQDMWLVPGSGGFGFQNIRNLNKFINDNEERIANGIISDDKTLIDHYMGEAYVIRAMLYYGALCTYGDYPIVDKELNVDDDLVAAAARQPRNLVTRHILADLDKAITLLMDSYPRNQRISKSVAYALKSRVALYEGTFELYHRGSGRVPGDADWPGKDKSWNADRTFDQEAEVEYFLTQAMEAAKVVADKFPLTPNSHVMDPTEVNGYHGWNSYYDMFAYEDLSEYPEVLLWEQFDNSLGVAHLTSNKLLHGAATGWTRGLVESFLMQNGLPIYAEGSGYHGDKSIDETKTDRDERLQLFLFGESTPLSIADSISLFTVPNLITNDKEIMDVTGYRQRKLYNYDPVMQNGQNFSDRSGLIHVRAAEAYLNYIEASYLLHGTIDETARRYWTALRERSGITAPIETTINATDMSYEADVNRPSYDWGAFSAGKPVDATLYSIRRERRSEFAGEGYRWDDLVRWRALDQVKNYQIEGLNFWDEKYKEEHFEEVDPNAADKEDKEDADKKQQLIDDGGNKATISSRELSKYIHPYQIVKSNNILYNGYTFYQTHYLSPFSVEEMQLASPTKKAEDSNLYQNPGWPTTSNGMAEY